jgi:hypothetical protein
LRYPRNCRVYDVNNFDRLEASDDRHTLVVGKATYGPNKLIAWIASTNRCNFITSNTKKEYLKGFDMIPKIKNSVLRGKKRLGIFKKYYCFGYRKEPKDTGFGKYSYKPGGNKTDIDYVESTITSVVETMEAIAKPFFRENTYANQYLEFQKKYKIPSITKNGYASQFSIGYCYSSNMHTDKDYFYTVITAFCDEKYCDNNATPIYHFCFPDYNIAIPMYSGSIIIYDPRNIHNASNPLNKHCRIMSSFVSKNLIDTVISQSELNKECNV